MLEFLSAEVSREVFEKLRGERGILVGKYEIKYRLKVGSFDKTLITKQLIDLYKSNKIKGSVIAVEKAEKKNTINGPLSPCFPKRRISGMS